MSTPWQEAPSATRRVPFPNEPLHAESRIPLLSGNFMPVIGLGSWMLTSHTAESIQHAFEIGYRMIDTAEDYMTQEGIGRAIRRYGAPRESLFIVMKVEPEGNSYDATARNLEELKLGYADLVLIHEAPEQGVGEKIWEGLMRARDDGMTRDIGVCSYPIDQLRTLAENTGEWPAVHQVEWSPFGHSLDMLSFCGANGIALQAYAPLTRGKRLDDARLAQIARRHNKSPAQVILRWNLQHGVAPIPKAYRDDHQRENLDVFDFELDASDMGNLDGLNENFSALEKLEYL